MPCEPACPTCAALRSAALGVVGEGGIDALSLQSLGASSDMAPELLTRHYPTAALCLYDTYEETLRSIREDFASAFARGSSWAEALALGVRELLTRMSRRPEEARLCFIEVLRGDRELLRCRDGARRLLLELFRAEHQRRRRCERLPDMQLELLIGAGFQAIASAVGQGRIGEPELESELAELAGVFQPLPA